MVTHSLAKNALHSAAAAAWLGLAIPTWCGLIDHLTSEIELRKVVSPCMGEISKRFPHYLRDLARTSVATRLNYSDQLESYSRRGRAEGRSPWDTTFHFTESTLDSATAAESTTGQ